jgi:hypothetical protein
MNSEPLPPPEGRTSLESGNYVLSISGPKGLILSVTIDIAKRGVLGGQFEDTALKEILTVQSLAECWIITQNEIQHRERRALNGGSQS